MIMILYRLFLICSLLFFATQVRSQELPGVSSGDAELDRIRVDVQQQQTTRENFKLRALKMKLWMVTLQQQGARLDAYLPVDAALRKDIWWNTIDRNEGNPQPYSDEQMFR